MKRLQNQVVYLAANQLRKLGYNFKEEEYASIAEMKGTIEQLEGGIHFKIEQYPDGSWSAESTNIDGIMTGGKDSRHIAHTIKDAIFTYFEVPPHLSNDLLLRSDNEPASVRQRVHVSA